MCNIQLIIRSQVDYIFFRNVHLKCFEDIHFDITDILIAKNDCNGKIAIQQ